MLAYEDLKFVDVVVTRSKGVTGAVSAQFNTSNLTATAPADYTITAASLQFADGEVVKSVRVPLVLDNTPEAQEKFQVALSAPGGGAALGVNVAPQAILFDHDPQHPFYFIDDMKVDEPAGNPKQVMVPIRISGSNHPIDIDYNTADATAVAGQDYVATSGQVTFAVGETTKLVAVTVLPDVLAEGEESFYLEITGFANQDVIVADGEGEIVISSDGMFADSFD